MKKENPLLIVYTLSFYKMLQFTSMVTSNSYIKQFNLECSKLYTFFVHVKKSMEIFIFFVMCQITRPKSRSNLYPYQQNEKKKCPKSKQ